MLSKIHLRNVKGITGSFDLFPNTLIVGASGTGKSAILAGVKIALTGYTELGKKAGATMALASDSEMEVSVESETGDIISRLFIMKPDGNVTQTIKINGTIVKAADVASKIPQSLALPVESIHTHEFTSLSDDKQAEFIFKALGTEFNQLSPDQLATNFKFFNRALSYGEVIELFSQEASVINKEIDRCKLTIQKLTGECVENTVSGNLQEWEEKKKLLNTQLNELSGQIAANDEKAKLASSKVAHLSRLQTNIADAEKKIENCKAKITNLQNSMVEVDASIPSVAALEAEEKSTSQAIAVLFHEIAELKKNIAQIQSAGICPCCKTPASDLGDALFDLDILVGDKSEVLEATQNAMIAIKQKMLCAKSYEKNSDIVRDINIENTAIEQYSKTLSKLTTEFSQLNVTEEEAPVSSEILQAKQIGLKAQVEEAEKAIKAFCANQAVRQQKSSAEAQRMKLEETARELASGIEEIRKIRTNKLSAIQDKLRASFDKMVEGAMPGCMAFLSLVKNDKPAFDFGFYNANQDRVPFAAACGGERTILLAALIACIQTLTDNQPGLGIMELAEADDRTLESFVSTLPAIGFKQSIAATCHIPSKNTIDPMIANGKIAVIEMVKPVAPIKTNPSTEEKAAEAI